jgi:hypothetical protein
MTVTHSTKAMNKPLKISLLPKVPQKESPFIVRTDAWMQTRCGNLALFTLSALTLLSIAN